MAWDLSFFVLIHFTFQCFWTDEYHKWIKNKGFCLATEFIIRAWQDKVPVQGLQQVYICSSYLFTSKVQQHVLFRSTSAICSLPAASWWCHGPRDVFVMGPRMWQNPDYGTAFLMRSRMLQHTTTYRDFLRAFHLREWMIWLKLNLISLEQFNEDVF